ncbi:RNA polymerase sigma factor [Kitasatospora indigofera]|uniref:RNA polymerase sigma factor n=1 Tax=Kitasatospora indigofera TaxID=67307 RepID=UPI003633B62E
MTTARPSAEAVTALFRASYDEVLRYAQWLSGNDEQAKDLVQRAFHDGVKDWHRLDFLALDGQVAWLKRVCRNKHIDDLRRDGRFKELREALYARFSRSPRDPADMVVDRAAVEQCWKSIVSMPPVRRTVAVLVWRDQMETLEIAAELGISAATVRVHLHRARRQLERDVGLPFEVWIPGGEERKD